MKMITDVTTKEDSTEWDQPFFVLPDDGCRSSFQNVVFNKRLRKKENALGCQAPTEEFEPIQT
jgi:hypothetical protein